MMKIESTEHRVGLKSPWTENDWVLAKADCAVHARACVTCRSVTRGFCAGAETVSCASQMGVS